MQFLIRYNFSWPTKLNCLKIIYCVVIEDCHFEKTNVTLYCILIYCLMLSYTFIIFREDRFLFSRSLPEECCSSNTDDFLQKYNLAKEKEGNTRNKKKHIKKEGKFAAIIALKDHQDFQVLIISYLQLINDAFWTKKETVLLKPKARSNSKGPNDDRFYISKSELSFKFEGKKRWWTLITLKVEHWWRTRKVQRVEN